MWLRSGLRGGSNGWTQSGEIGEDESEEGRQAWFRSMWEGDAKDAEKQGGNVWDYDEDEPGEEPPPDETEDDEDGFGDDFDDFAEGGEDDGDFGDFGEADDEPTPQPQPQPQRATIPAAPDILAGLVSSMQISSPTIRFDFSKSVR